MEAVETTTAPMGRDLTVWPDTVKELAFELWIGPAGRSVARAARLIAGDPYAIKVAPSTMYEWVTAQGWHDEADRRMRSIAPMLGDLIHGEALSASLLGVRRLAAILGDPLSEPGDVIRAARGVAEIAGIVGRAANVQTLVMAASPTPTPTTSRDEERAASIQASRQALALSPGERDALSSSFFERFGPGAVKVAAVEPSGDASG